MQMINSNCILGNDRWGNLISTSFKIYLVFNGWALWSYLFISVCYIQSHTLTVLNNYLISLGKLNSATHKHEHNILFSGKPFDPNSVTEYFPQICNSNWALHMHFHISTLHNIYVLTGLSTAALTWNDHKRLTLWLQTMNNLPKEQTNKHTHTLLLYLLPLVVNMSPPVGLT